MENFQIIFIAVFIFLGLNIAFSFKIKKAKKKPKEIKSVVFKTIRGEYFIIHHIIGISCRLFGLLKLSKNSNFISLDNFRII